jgi:hypothetical protein
MFGRLQPSSPYTVAGPPTGARKRSGRHAQSRNIQSMAISQNSTLTWHRRLLYDATNWALFFGGVVSLGFATWYGTAGRAGTAATLAGMALAFLLAATIDRFESLKGLGIEAKTRKLDQKIEQADEALSRLREVAELSSSALIDLNCKVGRWDSAPPPRESYELAQKVRRVLTALGASPARVRGILEPWARIMCNDLASALTRPLREATAQVEQTDDLRTYRARLGAIWQIPLHDYPDQLLKLINDAPLADAGLLTSARRTAESFARDMVALRETLEIPDHPERWFEAIEFDRYPHPKR